MRHIGTAEVGEGRSRPQSERGVAHLVRRGAQRAGGCEGTAGSVGPVEFALLNIEVEDPRGQHQQLT